MLEHLFGSRTRIKLLTLFLRHPDEAIFVRELSRRIGTQINAVRRELSNLVRLGLIIETETVAPASAGDKKQPGLKKKYYRINPNFILLSELTALLMKAQVLLEKKLDREIAKMGDVRYLAFMGLFLSRDARAFSPVDLFLVGRIDKSGFKTLISGIEQELGLDLNFSLMTPEEYQYRKDIADRFLSSILEAPKSVLINRLEERA
ncbi:MAG TPA: winged helix-turn-helix domain-containing protein [Patescibacteria group bacterium]|nr:winged helix-turn-helix domain-containing protein [Patescibacteria group bacterium]